MDASISHPSRLLDDAASLMRISPKPDIIFAKGQGDWLFDTRGRKYLDWVQGWAVNCLGHSHPNLVAAIQLQAPLLLNCSPGYYNIPMIGLARKLAELSFADQVFFANSGAEANEGAVKLARKWGMLHRGGAHEIITFSDGFHGRTLSMMAASGKPEWTALFEPKTPGFQKAIYNDIDSVRAQVNERTVGIMLELVQGEGGVIAAEPAFVRALRGLCDEKNLLLIVDEVQTGIGRTGTFFSYQQHAIVPDIMTLGKGLGGGVPIAALLARQEVCCFEPGDQGGTYNGNALVTAAASAVVDVVGNPDFLESVRKKSDYFLRRLEQINQRYRHKQVRGRGLLLAIELATPNAKQVVEHALSLGFLINAPRNNVLRFMPALTIEYDAIDHGISLLHDLMQGAAA